MWMTTAPSRGIFFSNLASAGQVLFFMHGDGEFDVFVTVSAMRCETACALGHGSCIHGDFDIEIWAYGKHECISKTNNLMSRLFWKNFNQILSLFVLSEQFIYI